MSDNENSLARKRTFCDLLAGSRVLGHSWRTRFDTIGSRGYGPAPFRRMGLVTKDREPCRSTGSDRQTGKAGIVVGNSPSILVVDGLSETTAVLKAVFEPRGHAVNRVRQSELPSGSASRPRVLVWHANDSEDSQAAIRFDGVPRIVIGRGAVPIGDSRRFSQPFEYGELLQAIESLLAAPAA